MRRGRWSSCADLPGTIAAAAIVLLAPPPAPAADLGDGRIHLRHATLSARADHVPSSPRSAATEPETWIVSFDGPADERLRGALRSAGGRIAGYVPSHAYLVRGDVASAQAMASLPGVIGVRRYAADWRVDPDLRASSVPEAGSPWLLVDVWPGEDVRAVADRVRERGLEVVRVSDRDGLRRLLVRADARHAPRLAEISEVEWVSAPPRPALRNDVVRWVVQSNVEDVLPLWDAGLLGEGQILGHIDAPLDLSSCYFLDPDRSGAGPDHRKVVGYRRGAGDPLDPHGSHTAGTAVGDRYDDPEDLRRGLAPRARITQSSYFQLDGFDNAPSNLLEVLEDAHADGARVHSNSYGDDGNTSYTTWCVDIDTFTRNREEDLVVFSATNGGLVKSPENAKNCLSVGATRRPPSQDLISNGGSGPTVDGRRKPELFAPGQSTVSVNVGPCNLTTRSGTSMAAPAISAGAILVREYLERGFHRLGRPSSDSVVPTGALLKAILLNASTDMTGVSGYPSNEEGWGRLLLDDALYFAGDDRRFWFRDVRHAQGLETGAQRSWRIPVVDGTQSLAVTMVFTDAPASLGAASAPVNDLDLVVEGPDGTFLGNSFDTVAGHSSIATFGADPLNNVERFLLPSPTPGDWTIRVLGASVPMGPQGFALVVNGGLSPRIPEDEPTPPTLNPPFGTEPEFSLSAAAPSPFRGSTSIAYAIDRPGRVTLRLYDLRGRVIRTLVDRELEGGEFQATWDGRDDAGRSTAAGIYFLRLRSDGRERLQRVVRL